jgi:hypothetical protein
MTDAKWSLSGRDVFDQASYRALGSIGIALIAVFFNHKVPEQTGPVVEEPFGFLTGKFAIFSLGVEITVAILVIGLTGLLGVRSASFDAVILA